MKRWGAAGALAAGAGIIAAAAAARRQVREEVWPVPTPREITLPEGTELLRTTGRHPVDVLYAAPTRPAAPTVLYLHANGEDLADARHLVTELQADGLGVACVEYVGYGPRATASATYPKVLASVLDAARLVTDRPETTSVLALGLSLGCALATQVAAHGLADGLVLCSPLTRLTDLSQVPRPTRLWAGAEAGLDIVRVAPSIDVPVLVVHGEDDHLVPVQTGREVALAFPEAHFLAVPGVGHDDMAGRRGAAVRIALTPRAQWPERWPGA